jgi:hypothetical protein
MSDIWQNEEFLSWFNGRPDKVKEVVKLRPPGTYRMKDGKGGYAAVNYDIIAYDENEDGTITLRVHTDGAFGLFPRQVFGIKPEDLELVTNED